MAWALLVTGQLLLAGVLAFSAGAKLLDPGAYAAFRASLPANLRLPERLAGPLAAAVVTAEAVLAGLLALAVAVPALAPGALLATTALLTTFTAALAAMVRRGVRQACHCFGTATRPPGPADVVRNLVLLAVSASATAAAWPAPPPPPAPNGAAMPHLPAILALLAAVCVLNTGLIVLVLRLLRQQTVLVRASIEGVANPEPIMTAGGGRVAAFTAVTVDGEPLSADQLDGDTLVGFLSPSCPACAESLPGFLARAEELGGRERVLAVVLGQGSAADALCERITPVARVVNEPERGPVSRAFGVDGYPAFALLSGHTVVASHFVLDKVPSSSAG
ncbi:TlpA family protein disulfide reductase [Catellatospora bangladeshensis]|uniref:Thioredoxin domain-containing protein n=1 Tax=Catellatospora bangladeshensis TaxID=310355 RepID=A0A8J3NMT4_9ACTN|nr:MauE/DoxX family redox-associated membrane protein [Catellatospora bangladeshensis]GIF84125.1 hypothetical protein Cba03nite_54740 [Catellatospora bangladeshensis]